MRLSFLPVLALLAFAGACADGGVLITECGPTASCVAPGVSAAATADGIMVANQASRPVFLFAADMQALALIDWIPCTSGPACPSLAPGASRLIPWSSVAAYQPASRQFAVYWWFAETAPDGTVRNSAVQSVVITR